MGGWWSPDWFLSYLCFIQVMEFFVKPGKNEKIKYSRIIALGSSEGAEGSRREQRRAEGSMEEKRCSSQV